jgi:hypothetical protein
MSEGGETGIRYQHDFEFYLELLFKPGNKAWALDVLNCFNEGVFRKKGAAPSSSVPASIQDIPNSWEDNILAQLGNTPGGLHSAEPES